MRLPALLVVLMIACSGIPALGAEKTDVLVLNNGDRITGEILNLSRGRVELKTDNAGTIEVEWDKIVSVESRHLFTITTDAGLRLVGTLERTSTPGTVRLGGVGGDRVLPLNELTGIEPLGQSFWKKLTGSVGAGFNYTRSSGVSQFTFNSDTTYRQPAFLVYLSGATTLTGQNDDSGYGSVANAQFLYERYRGRRWFIAGLAQLETNPSVGLVLRSQAGGLLGARLVNTNRAQMQFGAGLMGNNEQGVDVPATQNIEGLITLRSSYYTYDRPKTNVDVNVEYYPSLSRWGRQRLQLNTNLKREVWKNFYVGVTLYDTFDSAPPNSGAFRNDVGVSMSVSWSFGS
jgi:Protein of unknown function, DUF481